MPETIWVKAMAGTRLVSASLELTGALLMWRAGRLETAVRINGLLGVVGPVVLGVTMLLGVAGLATRLPLGRLAWIGAGVLLIWVGTTR